MHPGPPVLKQFLIAGVKVLDVALTVANGIEAVYGPDPTAPTTSTLAGLSQVSS